MDQQMADNGSHMDQQQMVEEQTKEFEDEFDAAYKEIFNRELESRDRRVIEVASFCPSSCWPGLQRTQCDPGLGGRSERETHAA